MGYALADELAGRGAAVTLVSGPVSLTAQNNKVEIVKVTSAAEMHAACLSLADDYDIAIMAAAVADYTPAVVAGQKIKKGGEDLSLILKKTKDILADLGNKKKSRQVLVGFALETDDGISQAAKKLKEKNADLIVLNSLKDEGAGFGLDTNKVTLFYPDGKQKEVELKSKKALAKDIVDAITALGA
jgi:phosphopantothenoylcysteine decarboxylase/phosphopantothenate--cysteine ligase